MFGLGPSSLPFGPTYKLFLRSVHATEHLFLAYIQNSDYELPLGVELPTKLKGWIKGYPKMLPRSPEGMESPRPNQRMVTVASVRRNVRLYSTDLVSTATTWCTTGEHTSKSEWTRTVPSSSGEYSKPQYTDDYKKQLNLPKGAEPKLHYDGGLRPGMPTPMAGVPSSPAYRNPIDDAIARSHPELSSTSSLTSSTTSNEERYKNLADLQWSQFSESGFKAPDSKLLQFDLGETARRNARNPKKRETVNWNDFALAGFDRPPSKAPLLGEGGRPDTPIGGKDGPLPLLPLDPLAEVLQFSVPLERPDAWTDHSAEITRKLRKQQKALPNFGWETTAISGRNWVVEESMIAAWAELCLSSGWMDRGEGTFRESNWVLIEFKAIPIDPSTARPSSREGSDPRTSGQWYLVEEFIPREYRDDLQHPKKKKNPLFASLTPKSKKWTSAATVNGHPYTGRPRSPDPRDYEFDAVIRNSSSTTKLTLGGGGQPPPKQPELNRVATPTRDTSSAAVFARPKPVRAKTGGDAPPETPSKAISAPLFVPPRGDSLGSGSGLRPMPAPVSAPAATLSQPDASPPETPSKSSMGISSPALGPKITNSFARLKPGRRTGQTPAEWDASIEFEARSESDSDEGDATRASGPNVPPKDGAKRLSKQDPWVDIVVRNPDEQNGSIGRVSGSGPHHQNGADSGDSGHARYDNSSDGHGMDPERAQAEIDQVMRGIPRLSDGPEDITPRRSLDDDEVVRPRHRPTGRADADEVGVPSGLVHRRAATDLRAPKSREELAAASPTSPDASTPNRAARLPLPTSPYPPGRSPPPGAAPAVRQLPTIPPAPQTASPTSPVASPPPRSSSVPQGRNGNGSGVSSLVNMYQNKEAAALATIPPALLPKSQQSPSTAAAAGGNGLPESPAAARSLPSTPARPSAIPVPVGSQKPPALAAPTPHNAVAETSSIITDASGESIEPLDPPQPIFEPPRVPSPARYVHGAPLTNVLEEEEEE
ncbi:hypothetical protein DL93DRAFT_2072957 [Clavulina sp. PMI_390]|nr:hypothetical protein DL93DRAFT_2072957 [Clavulina sp. PMI_390]